MVEQATYQGTGKRKTSVARVILRPGDGTTWINGRTIEDYFPRATHRTIVMSPLKLAGAEGRYDLRVRVNGGGPTGQAGAVRHTATVEPGGGGVDQAVVEVVVSVPFQHFGRDLRIMLQTIYYPGDAPGKSHTRE